MGGFCYRYPRIGGNLVRFRTVFATGTLDLVGTWCSYGWFLLLVPWGYIQSHYVVVHVEAVTDREISLTENLQAKTLIETHCRVVSVDIQFHRRRPVSSHLTNVSNCGIKQKSADTTPLLGRHNIDLMEMEQHTPVISI